MEYSKRQNLSSGCLINLRPRERLAFPGFTKAEIEKMEKLLVESGEQTLDREFCQRITKAFNRSSGRAGKPALKWAEVQYWFQTKHQEGPSKPSSSQNASRNISFQPQACASDKPRESSKGKAPDQSELEFEARSSKDGAWYDVEMFLAHRFLDFGEAEVLVRFIGFGAEEDEWVNIKNGVRERSFPLEHSECHKIKAGDLVLCFQERRDQAIHYDAHVLEIQRRMHDIRGCRCLFLIRYIHDISEERVPFRRLCCRPTY